MEPAPGTGRGLFGSDGWGIRGTRHPERSLRATGRSHSPHVGAVILGFCARAGPREIAMKKLLVAALIATSFFSFQARAQERAGSAALGAVSGAVVLGPIGAVAGAFIGYAAGPSIARSWGLRRSTSHSREASHPRDASHPREASRPDDRRGTQSAAGTREPAAPQLVVARASPPPAAKSPETLPTQKTAPPVQGFE
jgi:hypothetical protein